MIKRVLFDVLIVLSAVILPIWMTIIIVFLGALLFRNHFESLIVLIVIGLAYDKTFDAFYLLTEVAVLILIWIRTFFGIKYLKSELL